MTDIAKKEELAQARATASQIRQGIHTYLSTLALIDRAWREGHWRVLGYASWETYVDGEFGEERLKLPAEHRRKAVEELRLAGMSNRAIAAAVGSDERTVRRDLAGAAHAAPDSVIGTDGKSYAASRPSTPSGDRKADARPVDDSHSDDEASIDATSVGAGETATETPGASVLVDADGEESSTDSVRVDAAGGPTDQRQAAGPPVNPLDDPEQVEFDRRERTSDRVATGLVNLFCALGPDPAEFLIKWRPDAYRNRGIALVEEALSTTGLRQVADRIYDLADYLDKTEGSL